MPSPIHKIDGRNHLIFLVFIKSIAECRGYFPKPDSQRMAQPMGQWLRITGSSHMVMSECIVFSVRGLPIPQGSTKGFYNPTTRHVHITTDNNKLKSWRNMVATVLQSKAPETLWDGPVSLGLLFRLPMPKAKGNGPCRCHHLPSCHRKECGKRLACRGEKKLDDCHCTMYIPAKPWPSSKPDLDKLVRAVNDALTGIVLQDDSQVVAIQTLKEYGVPGVEGLVVKVDGAMPFTGTDMLFRPVQRIDTMRV